MIDYLTKYLDKLGLTSFTELNEEEKETYRKWQASLSGRRLTDEEVLNFFRTELEDATVKVISQKNRERQDIFLKMKIEMIRNIQMFLNTPALEKSMTEQSIENLMEKS